MTLFIAVTISLMLWRGGGPENGPSVEHLSVESLRDEELATRTVGSSKRERDREREKESGLSERSSNSVIKYSLDSASEFWFFMSMPLRSQTMTARHEYYIMLPVQRLHCNKIVGHLESRESDF